MRLIKVCAALLFLFLIAPALHAQSVTLTWTPGDNSATSFNVYRGTSPSPLAFIASVSASAQTYSDTTVVTGTLYYYAVTAVNANGESSYSNEVSIIVGAPIVNVAPSSTNFGSVVVNSTTGSQNTLTFTVTNNAAATLVITLPFSPSGTNASDFGIYSNGCANPPYSGTLTSGQSCNIVVQFNPQGAGSRTAQIVLSDNATPSTQTINLSGTGLSVSPPPVPSSPMTIAVLEAAQ